MKPFPKSLLDILPLHVDAHQERPWWSWDDELEVWLRIDNEFARSEEEVLKYDEEDPLDHPGYRAGQVWADEFGNTVQIVRVGRGTVYYVDPATFPHLATAQDDLPDHPYLLADPAFPHLAPWSPAISS